MENKKVKIPTLEEAIAMVPKEELREGDKEMLAKKHPLVRWFMALRSQGKSSIEVMKIMTPDKFHEAGRLSVSTQGQ